MRFVVSLLRWDSLRSSESRWRRQPQAQTGLATVTGIVSDASGAAVPGLTVTATNQATNIAYTGVTNDGRQLHHHQRADWRVRHRRGSARVSRRVQSKVTLSAAQTARVDFKMEVGNVEERVDVVATGAVLQTENAVVGTKVEREQIEQLPAQGAEPVDGHAVHRRRRRSRIRRRSTA